jgi:hypothetical protein
MELTILLLVVILTGCLVGIRSNAARSLAVAELRALPPRHRVRGRQRHLPPLPATTGSFARRASPAVLFVLQHSSRRRWP